MYGAQTRQGYMFDRIRFENDVEMYGAQTEQASLYSRFCLRMM